MMMGGGAGPFSGLNNFLFGFQSVVFSLGQAMQVRSLVRYLHILGVACTCACNAIIETHTYM